MGLRLSMTSALLACVVATGACQKASDAPEVEPEPVTAAPTTVAATSAPAPLDTSAPSAPETAPTETTPETVAAETTPETEAAGDSANEVAGAADLRETIRALAVASECLRKNGATPDQMSTTMLALYKAHDVDLDTYTREMTRLGADPTFQAELQKAASECPIAAVDPTKDPGTDPTKDPAKDPGTDPGKDPVKNPPTDPVKNPPTDPTKLPIKDPPRDPSKDPQKDPREPGNAPGLYAGTWTGTLTGRARGNLRVVISGKSVTSAVATFGRVTIKLVGQIDAKGRLSLGGSTGKLDALRLRGTVDRGGRQIMGTWDGTLEKSRADGHFRLSR